MNPPSLDQSQYVPFSPPRPPRIDFTREFFCCKWGDTFPCICPPRPIGISNPTKTNQLVGVGKEMASFNYFSAPSIKMEGVDSSLKPTISKAEKKGLVVLKEICKKQDAGINDTRSPEKGSAIKPGSFPVHKMNSWNFPASDNFQGFDISPDLPFRVCINEYPSLANPVIRTGVDRCLRPSQYRAFESSYKENFIDFFKTKTPAQLALYRTPLVIDHRRPRPSIPLNSNPRLDGEPISFNARPMGWKQCGKKRSPSCKMDDKPDFEVCISGPIIVPTDYEW